MTRSIFLPFDNSLHALAALEVAIQIAKADDAELTACHVYAAALHDRRFRQMEGGLPEPYRKEEKLVEQREVHNDLIGKGLSIISQSYLDVVDKRCAAAGVAYRQVSTEGKNWKRLTEVIAEARPDLVVMGAQGLGAVEEARLGRVCERVARRIDRDLLVVRNNAEAPEAPIVAAIDGSARSFGALTLALDLGRRLDRPVEAVAAFDPDFHYVAFARIADVLSPEAASIFRFKEQEKLHEDVIDGGLAKIYQSHLDLAEVMAEERGATLRTTLLAGKPFAELLRFARGRKPWMMVLGRTGIHADDGLDLGGASENLLRLADCHVLLAARAVEPPLERVADINLTWTEEAEARMDKVPAFAKGMARQAVQRFALDKGHTVVTSDAIDACLAGLMPGGAVKPGTCPFAADTASPPNPAAMLWETAAEERLAGVPAGFMRQKARQRIEDLARDRGLERVTPELADIGLAESRRRLTEMLGKDVLAQLPS